MITRFPVQKTIFSVGLTSSLLAFALGFGMAYQQNIQRFSEAGQMAWAHLLYAEELKDDMAVIDWSKNLEKLDSVAAFQVMVDSKITAEGGNQTYLPSQRREGLFYVFPAQWTFHTSSLKNSQGPKEMTVVFQASPGPLLWGLIFGGLCLLTAIGAGLVVYLPDSPKTAIPDHPVGVPQRAAVSPPSIPRESSHGDLKKPYLFLDKNYVIQLVTPEAAKLLQKTSEELIHGHLLDLEPEPSLMQAIEKAEPVRFLKPFPSHPRLLVSLKSDPNGTLLFLESVEQTSAS